MTKRKDTSKTIGPKPVKKPAGKAQPIDAKREAAVDQGIAKLADKLHANA
jgi:hypothetical protein